jgi:hypothetical protein
MLRTESFWGTHYLEPEAAMVPGSADAASAQWERWTVSLDEWAMQPGARDEDGLTSPSLRAIERARRILRQLLESAKPEPNSVIEDGNGGIVLNHRSNGVHEKIHVSSEGSAEYQRFEHSRLVLREEWL